MYSLSLALSFSLSLSRSHTQLGVGLLIVFFFLVWHLLLQPFATTDLNRMQTAAQISLLLTLFVGIMLIIDKYMEREFELLASGPWGMVDSGAAYLQELNRAIFTMIGVAVNVFTMCATPLLMANKMYKGMGSREQMITKARDQVKLICRLFWLARLIFSMLVNDSLPQPFFLLPYHQYHPSLRRTTVPDDNTIQQLRDEVHPIVCLHIV
jgi:hypothetical protein